MSAFRRVLSQTSIISVLYQLLLLPMFIDAQSISIEAYSRANDQSTTPYGTNSYIKLNGGASLIPNGFRGHNVVVFSEITGEVIDTARFDTCNCGDSPEQNGNDLFDYLNDIPSNDRIITIVIHDEGSVKTINKTMNLLQSWSCTASSPGWREGFVFIGVPVPTSMYNPTWQTCLTSARDASPIYRNINIPLIIKRSVTLGLYSRGYNNSQSYGFYSFIKMDHKENLIVPGSGGSAGLRGHSVVVIDRYTGEYINGATYDTWSMYVNSEQEDLNLHNYLLSLESNNEAEIIVITVWDEGSGANNTHKLLQSWGCNVNKPKYREPFIFIGTADSNNSPSWQTCSTGCTGLNCEIYQLFDVPLLTKNPTESPTINPSNAPTKYPTNNPSIPPTVNPSNFPSGYPTNIPSTAPTNVPSNNPTYIPSAAPTTFPSNNPTQIPTVSPSNNPTQTPTYITLNPTQKPTVSPSPAPTLGEAGIDDEMTTEFVYNSNVAKNDQNDSDVELIDIKTIGIMVGILMLFICLCVCIGYYICRKKKILSEKTTSQMSIEMNTLEQDKSNDNNTDNTMLTPMGSVTMGDESNAQFLTSIGDVVDITGELPKEIEQTETVETEDKGENISEDDNDELWANGNNNIVTKRTPNGN